MRTPPPSAGVCKTCPTRLVHERDWEPLSKTRRDNATRAGYAKLAAHGQCTRCYQRVRAPKVCPRCGVKARLTNGICDDCTTVCSDLGDLARWAS